MKPQPLVPVFVVLMLVGLPAAFVQGWQANGGEAESVEAAVRTAEAGGRHELNS